MQGSLDHPPIVIRGKRWRGAWFLLLAAFFALQILGIRRADTPILVIVAPGLLLAVFAAAGVWMIVRPARLDLDPDGFTQTVLWRRRRYVWADVFNFRVVAVGLTRRMVGFDFVTPPARGLGFRSLNASMIGAQAVLQGAWERPAAEVADLFNTARERWLYGEAPTGAVAGAPAAKTAMGGRMGQKPYLIAAGIITAILLAAAWFVPHGGGVGMSVILIWLYAARLHDIGRSGWWQALFFALQWSVTLGLLFAGQSLAVANLAGLGLQLLFTFALGAMPGSPGPNRFGLAPGQATTVAQSEVFR